MSRSKLALLGIGSATYDPSAQAVQSLLFSSFDPGHRQQPIDIGADMGGYSNLGHPVELTRSNIIVVQPKARLKPSTTEWNALLRWILNTNPGGIAPWTYNPGTASTFRVVDYHDTIRYHHLTGVVVSRAVISAQSRAEVVLDLDMVGETWTNAGAMPVLAPSLGTRFLFGDMSLSVGNIIGAVPCRSITITIDHRISADRYYFGFTQTPLNLDRVVTIDLDIPAALASTLFSIQQVDGGIPITATFVGTVAGVDSTIVFTFPAFRGPHAAPPANVPQEQFIRVSGQCFTKVYLGNTLPEISVVLTP